MGTREKILQRAKKMGAVRTSELVKELKISRQTLSAHLSKLVVEGKLKKKGSTRNSVYSLSSNSKPVASQSLTIKLIKKTKGLEEHIVFEELDKKLVLRKKLSSAAYTTFQYAFTEILNNAIDHSKSPKVEIKIELLPKNIVFEIRDFGIGIFFNVQKKFKFKSEHEGMEHVFKGKQSTMPEKHSGEGIFFTSRIADIFKIKSHKILATFDNREKDIFAKDERFEKGTKVIFLLNKKSRKTLSQLFGKFTDEEYNFDKNHMRVTLSKESGNLSRSQAKRLLFGLEKYKEIQFDFNGVKEIGQGFADEIFRVYAISHPNISLTYSNAQPSVDFMIKRAMKK